MALASQITAFCPEVLTIMGFPICRLHRIRMIEIDGARDCYRCPVTGCEQGYDMPPSTPSDRQAPPSGGRPAHGDVCVKPAEPFPKDNPLVERAFGYEAGHIVDPARWQRHLEELHEKQQSRNRHGLPPIPQSNITDGTRCLLLGSVEPGGGGSTGRSRKKGDKGGKKFTDGAWWDEGGTNGK